jgi:hypothetical protein
MPVARVDCRGLRVKLGVTALAPHQKTAFFRGASFLESNTVRVSSPRLSKWG